MRSKSLEGSGRPAAARLHRAQGARNGGDDAPPPDDVQGELALIADDLRAAIGEMREISQGMHPAILAEAGLGPALGALARRSTRPNRARPQLDSRLEEPLEVAGLRRLSSRGKGGNPQALARTG
jgi:hypothetical protein